ncbi:MAG: hypothetical protein ACE15D_05200 [Candidatus Eisenbacteria bacterium]
MGRMLLPLAVLLVLSTASVSIPTSALAVPPDAPSFLSSSLWHGANSVRVVDGKAYVVYGSGFAVFDVSDPANPLLLGRTYAYGGNHRVEVSWPYAFVGRDNGIRIIDVHDPKHPTEVGCYQAEEMVDFAITKNLAYVACWDGESVLQIVDFSNPAAPVLLGSCPAYGFNIAVAGKYVYMPGYHEGTCVIDVSQPDDPHLVARWDFFSFMGLRVDGNRAYCLWTSGEKKQDGGGADGGAAFGAGGVAAFGAGGLRDESGIMVYDLADPTNPVFLGEYRGTEWSREIFFHGGLAYVTDGDGCAVILDFSDPANPVVVGHMVTEGDSNDLDFAGDVAYVANGYTGLTTLDVSDPAEPQPLGSYWESGWLRGVAVDDRAAYVADAYSGLHIVDIADALRPEQISWLPLAIHPQAIALSGEYAFLGNRDAGLDVVDVGDLANPELVAHLDLPVSGIAIAGDRAYIVKDERFTTVDIHDPANPVILGGCTVPRWAWEVCVHGNFAYIGNSNVGLVVVDISDPAQPFMRGSVDTFDWMYHVVTNGSYVYADLGHNRLGVYDVTNPDAPRSIREIQLPGWLNGLQLAGDRLFAAADPGVRVYDVSMPSDPVEVGTGDGSGGWLAIRDCYVYLSGGGSFLVLGPTAAGIEGSAVDGGAAALRILASNPVGDEGKVRVQLARAGLLTVGVYDVAGRRLATLHDGWAGAGGLELHWSGAGSAPAGVYYVRASFEGRSIAQPVLKIQ